MVTAAAATVVPHDATAEEGQLDKQKQHDKVRTEFFFGNLQEGLGKKKVLFFSHVFVLYAYLLRRRRRKIGLTC